jgi:hypothetical protein
MSIRPEPMSALLRVRRGQQTQAGYKRDNSTEDTAFSFFFTRIYLALDSSELYLKLAGFQCPI